MTRETFGIVYQCIIIMAKKRWQMVNIIHSLIKTWNWWWIDGGRDNSWLRCLLTFVFAAATNRNISESATFSPVAFTSFTKMAWLCSVVVVVVAKFSVCWVASWTVEWLCLLQLLVWSLISPSWRFRRFWWWLQPIIKYLAIIVRNLFHTQPHGNSRLIRQKVVFKVCWDSLWIQVKQEIGNWKRMRRFGYKKNKVVLVGRYI